MPNIYPGLAHTRLECSDENCTGTCNTCQLFICSVCGGTECCLPTDCPGRSITDSEAEALCNGFIDFREGEWINLMRGDPQPGDL